MNTETKAKALDVYEKRNDISNSLMGIGFASALLDLVIDEDRSKLIPYIEDEIKAAKHLGKAGAEYAHELEHLKAMLEKEVEA